MKTRYRDVSEKYRSLRLKSSAIFHSRFIATLMNKFNKKGKKQISLRHIISALRALRFRVCYPKTRYILHLVLRGLRTNLTITVRRKAKKFLDVPIPVRRNKRDIANIQLFATAVGRRRERRLVERWFAELIDQTLRRLLSVTLRLRSAYLAHIFNERVNMDLRWK